MAYRVGADVLKGATETPRAIYTGARDAVVNTYDAIDDFSKWADKKIGDTTGFRGIAWGGGKGLHLMTDAEAGTGLSGQITGGKGTIPRLGDTARDFVDKTKLDPTNLATGSPMQDPKTVTGGLVKGVSQFLTGLALTKSASKAIGLPTSASGAAGYGLAALQGAAANFAAFDPHQQRLSNLIDKFPELSNPVFEYLSAKPGDTAVEGRVKNALEGLGLGTLTDGLMKGIRMLRGMADAKAAPPEMAPATEPGLPQNAFRELGDASPEAPLVGDQPFNGPPPGQPPIGGRTPLGNMLRGEHAEDVTRNLTPEEALSQNSEPPINPRTGSPFESAHQVDSEIARAEQEQIKRDRLLENPEELEQYAQERGETPDSMRRLLEENRASTNELLTKSKAAQNGSWYSQQKSQAGAIKFNDLTKPDNKTYINFARIDAPEDVEKVMQTLADRFKGKVDSARRGTQTFEQIKLNSQMENAWDLLQNRRMGDPMNAEQSVAARELWASSADKLKQLAQLAVQSPTEENLFSFRKMAATHYAIQSEVIGARTETARALASWRIPVGSNASRLQDITDRMMQVGGGQQNIRMMAQHVASLAEANYPHELEQYVTKSAWERTRDGLIQAFSDGLLSSPVTQAKILASNVSTGLWRIGERAWGAKVSQILGTQNGVEPGEASAMWSGWVGSFKDAMAYGWKAAKTGTTGEGIGDPHDAYPSNISAAALNLSDRPWLGRAADFIGNALSLGRRGIAAQHDVALTMAYRGEMNAQAVRQATQELNAGELAQGAFKSRVADLIANPPEAITQAAKDGAKYQAFLDEPGPIAQWLLDGRQKIPALRVIAPFIKIPARIMSYTFERTPLAPLMSDFRAKIASGGATRDLALAQMSMGTMIAMSAADMTLNGTLKGGGPPEKGLEQAQEREGMMRDSAKVGNRWYNINGVHPAGKLMLLAADVAEAINGGQHELHDDADTEKLAVGTALAIGRTLVDNSYFTGFANLFAALHDARVGGAGEGAILSTAGSAVPAISGAVARSIDPYQREIHSMLDEFKSKIPGLSKDLPPRRNLWGDPVPSGHDPITNFISPVKISDEKHEPIDDEILKQGFNITMPDRHQTFAQEGTSVPIDMSKYPKAYSRLLQLAGNELKHPAWNMGLKDLLNAVVSGDHPLSAVYNLKTDGPEGGKEVMIRDLISQYRDMAKKQVLEEFPAIQQEVADKADAKRELKFGAM